MKTKINKLAILTTLGILSATGSLTAQTVVDLTGSTAARGAAHAVILATLTGETYAFEGNASAGSANRAIYHGTYSGNSYIIRTYWAGSVNGVRDIARQTQQSEFLDKTILGSAGGTQVVIGTGAGQVAKAPVSAETAPEIGFSDVFQTSTEFTSPELDVEDEVGIIPFKWYKNKGASSNLTNITSLQLRTLYGSRGKMPLSILTGVAGDSATEAYVTGRNADSGSRITVMADMGYGVFSQVNQYTFQSSGGVITGATFNGNAGYSSGGNYAAPVLAATWAHGAVVSYLGATDWAGAEVSGTGAVPLSYNGVPYSAAAVQQGQYSCWGYLHQNRMNSLTGAGLTFYEGVRDGLLANPGSVLIKDDEFMTVQRDGDGAPIGAK